MGISSSKGDAGCLAQNTSGANTVIAKQQGHAGGGEHGTSNGDRVSWRLKPEVAELGPKCWQVYQVNGIKYCSYPSLNRALVGESVSS